MANLGLLNYCSVWFGSVKCFKKASWKNYWDSILVPTAEQLTNFLIHQLNYSVVTYDQVCLLG